MEVILQLFTTYLETDTHLQKNDLLRRIRKEGNMHRSKWFLVPLLSTLSFHHMYKDAKDNVFIV